MTTPAEGRIRVLVVDDSVVVRRLVTRVLEEDPGIEVVGAAANGRIALAKIAQLEPDVVTLDIEMPEMDGLATLAELRPRWPRLPVIMFSTLTERGAEATLEALSLGASDYVTKPTGLHNATEAMASVEAELLPRIKALHGRRLLSRMPSTRKAGAAPGAPVAAPAAPATSAPAVRLPDRPANARLDVVAIGVSTGGPNALADLLPALPASFPVPIVIVQHMPPVFTRMLANRLDARCGLAVIEAEGGEVLLPGRIHIAAGGRHLALARQGTQVVTVANDDPPENSCRPAVDVLFRSVAALYGTGALAVVLTGMGQDGLVGAEAIRVAGGQILAQDEASSVVWGMPGFVTRAGLADAVLPLDGLAAEIGRRVAVGRPLALGRLA
ncbi:MAG TPA: chemotaxis response regulator protein-glutamate methylesterase [Acidimicrobiia bacterium]|nr:chemotaxis response regulator protein-glutamate methylesterase [Acidimicrobiia bacterium]